MTTDYRPNVPLDPMNPRSDRYLDEPGPGVRWGWIVGALVALFLVFVFFGFIGGGQRTDTQRPATQTSTAPHSPAPTRTAQSPVPAQENTGTAPRDTTTGTRE